MSFNYEDFISDTDDFVVGMESFDSPFDVTDTPAQMAPPVMRPGMARPTAPLLIRTKRDSHAYRVYFNAVFDYSPKTLTGLYRFLSTLTEQDTVHFILGAHIDGCLEFFIGGLLSSLVKCKAKTHAVAAGYCSTAESLVWCFCDTRAILPYGALAFSISPHVVETPVFGAYYESLFEKALEVGALTQEEIAQIREGAECLKLE